MNTPNKLTLLRLLSVPFIILLMYINNITAAYSAFALFILSMITDIIDGRIAKRKKKETLFGKFLDPVTDKILILSIFFVFVDKGFIPMWLVLILLARELTISGLRSTASARGKIIGANWMGKTKAFSQTLIISITLLLNALNYSINIEKVIPKITTPLTLIMVTISVIFLFNFMYQNRKLILKDT